MFDVLLAFTRLVDRINAAVGRAVCWLVLAAVLISAGNALVRKTFDWSANALLEIQWYLFAAVFLLAAGYTLLKNEHVRIDILSARLSARARAWIDLVGGLLFLLPLALLILYHAWPFFWVAFVSQEWSNNPGGLIVWPAKLLIPVGFALLFLQGVSESIKRAAYLAGRLPAPPAAEQGPVE